MVPEDSLLLAPSTIPGLSTPSLPQELQKKRIGKKKQPDEIPRPTDRPATHSPSKPIFTTDESPKIAKTDQGKKSSQRHGEKDLVDKVSKLF